ncbi:AraC family transcriptional regulator [Streptomyces sp. TS71-3]|uniref:helix-turn-helix transcriptional regulator n=1 Tax=Streptomyces sp. TS71-3 TaxID=2733862 RepID=UPI001B299D0A|nr:AraC family transcriptional regulator [Streptomyces sp. TS71-3]GHJ41344.1 AraC family transcriptional regulator [Streptomyces sp. TS71-3]
MTEATRALSGGAVTRPAGLRAGFHAEVGDAARSGLWHAGEQWAPVRFLIPRHTHPVWEFYLQLHGMSRWYAGGRSHRVGPGGLLAVAPGVVHHMAERTATGTHFSFAGIAVERVLQRHPELKAHWHRAPEVVRRIGSLPLAGAFDQLIQELTVAREFSGAGLVLAVDRLVLEAARLLVPGGAAPRLATHPSVARVRALLDREYAHNWTLRDLGALVDLAPAYLASLFTSQVGLPPHRYLLRRRIERAKHLLATGDLPITGIGIEVGFGSGQHFARVFRRATGQAPSGYRRAARQAAGAEHRTETPFCPTAVPIEGAIHDR